MKGKTRWLAVGLLLILLPGCLGTQPRTQIVVLWHEMDGREREALDLLTDAFNLAHKGHIALVTEYQRDILDKLARTPPARQPDLVVLWSDELESYRYAKGVVSFGFLPLEMRREQGDILPMAASLFTIHDSLAALPLGIGTYVLYYNSDWLEELGYNSAEMTMETVRSLACAATAPDGKHVGMVFPLRAGTLLAFLTASGAELVGEDGAYHFADAAGIGMVNALNAMLSGGCAVIYNERQEGIARLSDSTAAMLLESSLYLPDVERKVVEDPNFSVSLAVPPALQGEGRTLWYGPGMLCIAPRGPRREAAFEVINWFFSPQAQELWSEAARYLPVRRSILKAWVGTDSTRSPLTQALARIALEAANEGNWVIWPDGVNMLPCRASLRRTLFHLGGETLVPGDYLDETMKLCNRVTGRTATPSP